MLDLENYNSADSSCSLLIFNSDEETMLYVSQNAERKRSEHAYRLYMVDGKSMRQVEMLKCGQAHSDTWLLNQSIIYLDAESYSNVNKCVVNSNT